MPTDHYLVTRYPALLLSLLTLAVAASLVPAAANASQPRSQARVVRTGTADTHFTLSSFNVLGSSHTAPGGKHARMASGPRRIKLAVRHLERHSVDVVGFQELQMDQYEKFMAVAGDRFGVYPGGVSRRTVQNSIGWRLDQWELVEAHTTPIPYFDGIEWDMPYVLLRERSTGALAWFANFHNPSRKSNAKWREEAVTREVALVNRLLSDTRYSVFVTGDMNDREHFYCRMVTEAPTKAANGGRFRDGVCTPPPYPMPVNWVVGVKRGGHFYNYVRDDSRLVNRITDHFVVRSDVRIKAAR